METLPFAPPTDPELAAVVRAWSVLPRHVRDTITTLVRSMAPTEGGR